VSKPIFLDPTGRRARFTNWIATAATFVGLSTSVIVAIGVAVSPRLPAVPRPNANYGRPGILQPSFDQEPFSASANRIVSDNALKTLRLAYFIQDDFAALRSLTQHSRELDGIIPDWLQLVRSGSGTTVAVDANSRPVIEWLRSSAPKLSVYPCLSTELSSPEIFRILANSATRSAVVTRLASLLAANAWRGVVVDFPELGPNAHFQFAVFLAELRSAVGDKKVIVVAPGYQDASLLQQISQVVDYVVLRTYELDTAMAGRAPASQGKVESQIATATRAIPADKLIIEIGAFGYSTDGFGGHELISAQEAWDLARRTGANLSIEPTTLNTTFSYVDAQKRLKKVWLLDAATAFNQVKSALAIRPAAIAIWRLGSEDPGIWNVVGRGRSPDAAAPSTLRQMEPGFGSFQSIRADALLSADFSPVTGKRELTYNPSMGLITAEAILTYPRQASIREWTARDPKAVALTFDDGPDPKYTPLVLDLLAGKGVKATFYLIGMQALAYPDLVKRIEQEGHDIGNHSFSHPDLNNASSARIAMELNSTARVLEAQLGTGTVLFRPPYFSEGYSYLEQFPQLAETSSRLGYLLASYDINPLDWISPDYHAGIEQMVTGKVLEGSGQIILLHDGGGNRQGIVDALPGIIDTLQHAGFHFVTTHELVGLSKAEVMPPLQHNVLQAVVWGGSARLVNCLSSELPTIAISTAVVGILRLIFICSCAWVQSRRRRSQPIPELFKGPIAVLIPAYNEEAIIGKTITAVLGSSADHPFEVIVVDDGSTDNTRRVVADLFANEPRVKLFTKKNGGKASALNFGLLHTNAEVVIALDADTVLAADAIVHLTRHFNDRSIGAVAGKVVVGNQVSLLARFQALEYSTSQNLDRRAFELFNAIGVVPGAIGAWRRDAVLGVGGYSNDTLAEDADLTVCLERSNWRVISDHQAHAWTEAPESLRPFLKQRLRWMFGTLQVAYKHRAAIALKPSGVSFITLPNVFLFQFGFTLLTPLLDAILVWFLAASVLGALSGTAFDGGTLLLIAAFWFVFQVADLLGAVVALVIDRDRNHWSLLPLLLLQRFTYRQLLYVTAIRALVTALKGVFVGWGKLARTGNVQFSFHPQS
jgi:cellulose synthase/poly-beta-1,6-N-acetylglucosamine synthase-like glycosyltransferase/peptidoglycan/xylan/chitin deacetylase (PgdA/CDA1 family)/spore germination protein YaaH